MITLTPMLFRLLPSLLPVRAALLGSAFAFIIASPGQAASFQWFNATGNWSDGFSWDTGTAPTGSNLTDVLTFAGDVGTAAGTAPNYTTLNDIPGCRINGMVFNATDLAGLPADPPLLVTGSSAILGGTAPFLTQNNAGPVTIDIPVVLAANTVFAGNGSGAVTLNLELSGLYDITKNGTSTFRLGTPLPVPPATGTPSENTWMGRLTLNDGTVRYNNNAFSGNTALRSNPVTLAAATATVTCSSELRTGTLSGPAGLVQTLVTGTNTPNENIVIQAITAGSYGGTLKLGPPTGTGGTGGTLTVRGPGEQRLTGLLEITKDVAIGGRLTLSGAASLGAQTQGAITMQGGTLTLDNATVNNNNRLRDASATSTGLETIGGGHFILLGNSGGTTETIGRLQLGAATKSRSGALSIRVVHTSTTGATVLTIGSLNRDTTTVAQTATVNFSAQDGAGAALPPGTAGISPRIIFSTVPVAANGLIGNSLGTGTAGFATVNGTDFAAHGANGVVAVTTGAFPSATAPTLNALLAGNGTVNITTLALQSLKLAPAAAGQTLTISSGRALDVPGILLAGSTDYAINGPGTLNGTGTRYYHVQQAALTIGAALPNQVCVKAGDGVLILTGANSARTQPLVLNQGTVRARQGSTLPGGELRFRGGVLELTGGGTFTRTLGSSAGNLNWSAFDYTVTPPAGINEERGSGGFSAIGADVSVDLNGAGPTLIPWEDPGFVQSNFAFVLGSTRATAKVTLVDNYQLTSTEPTIKYSPREFRVVDNPASTTDLAVISGIISGPRYNDFLKTGDGTLELTAVNTHLGAALVQAGTLVVTGSTSAGLATQVFGGATLTGAGAVSHILLESGGLVSPGRNGIGTLTANGCTWKSGGTIRCDLGAGGTADRLALGSGPLRRDGAGPWTFDFAGGGTNGNTYTLATFGSSEFSAASFTAANLAAGVTGYFQITGGNTLQFIAGTPSLSPLETWRQSFFGTAATNSGSAANGADPDFDGLTNLDEYALNSSPLSASAIAAPAAGRSGNFMTLSFNRNPAATDISIIIEASTTLAAGSWTTLATWTAGAWSNASGTTVTEAVGHVTFRDSVDLTGAVKRRQMRLRITAP